MYQRHFGLENRPFHASAAGSDVFVGPQIAATMAGLKKSLEAADAIVTVCGPVGSGKSTLVARALETVGEKRHVVSVARMHLDSDDVLELLLDELGVEDRPGGTFQKFAAFRDRLRALEDDHCRIVISVEDGVRLGADTLAEIEALTSADAGVSRGAAIVIMGDERLDELLREPQMARARQRTRQRYSLSPLGAAELRGYLRHCFRHAGADFEKLFETDAAPLLHHLCGGIPRIANNLVESALGAAAEQGLQQVPTALLKDVAKDQYGLSSADFDAAAAATTPPPRAEAAPEAASAPVLTPEPEAVPDAIPVAEAVPEVVPAPAAETAPEPVSAPDAVPILELAPEPDSAAEPAPEPEDETDPIPELIQDTLPDLEVLAPEFVADERQDTAPGPEITAAAEPEPSQDPASTAPAVRPDDDDVPAWDRDPTMAELKPDLDALEQALAFVQDDDSKAPDADSADADEADIPELIPEITLDHAIKQRIENNLIDEPGSVSPAAPAVAEAAPPSENAADVDAAPEKASRSDTEVDKIATELAKAKSIEDVDDHMAETLFGGEISLAASQVFAKPSQESANEDIGEAATSPSDSAATDTATDIELTLEAPGKLDDGGLDLSASQRLKTVRALNADLHPSLREPKDADDEPPSSPPESIEDQINTSMTQTLKALNVEPPVGADDDDYDEEGESRSGFFSRFKRS